MDTTILKKNTEIYVWGNDEYGQLGLGHRYQNKKGVGQENEQPAKQLSLPKSCSFQTQIVEIACGEDHSCLITSSGHLYAMGSNSFGKLGISGGKNPNLDYYNTPKLVDSLVNSPVFKVSCGWNHTAAITKDGQCYSWGQCEFGQLGRNVQS